MGSCQSPPSDLSEAQTGPRSIIRLEVCRVWRSALTTLCRWWVSAVCKYNIARELFPRNWTQLWSYLEISCQLCQPSTHCQPHCQPVYHTQKSLPPHLIQVTRCVTRKSTCPRPLPQTHEGRVGVPMELPNTLPHRVKERTHLGHPQS